MNVQIAHAAGGAADLFELAEPVPGGGVKAGLLGAGAGAALAQFGFDEGFNAAGPGAHMVDGSGARMIETGGDAAVEFGGGMEQAPGEERRLESGSSGAGRMRVSVGSGTWPGRVRRGSGSGGASGGPRRASAGAVGGESPDGG
jgi:hypothetical protein